METFQARRAAILYNPVAGRISRSSRDLKSAVQKLSRHGVDTTLVPTVGPGTAGLQARQQIEAGCDLIIAAGGDGTINEVANGMLHSRVPLAILPGGTANVLAREMRMRLDIPRAAEQINELVPCRISTGILRTKGNPARSFLLMTGAGLDAQIVYHLNMDLKAATGKFAYYMGGFQQVFRPISEFEVVVDGKVHAASFALISRVRNYGGDLEIARGASLLQDQFEVVLFQGKLSIEYLRYLIGVAVKKVDRMSGCTVLQARSVTCQESASDVYVQADGELIGKLPFTAEIARDSLTLLVPGVFLERERSLLPVQACA